MANAQLILPLSEKGIFERILDFLRHRQWYLNWNYTQCLET